MRDFARIGFGRTVLIIPAETPYEHEELFTAVKYLTNRRGAIRLNLNGQRCNVARVDGQIQECGACGRTICELSYRLDRQGALCTLCAQRALAAGCEWASAPDGHLRREFWADKRRRGMDSREEQGIPPPAL
jgi:hypothetical protein